MNGSMNVEHIFRAETCPANLARERSEMFVFNKELQSKLTESHLSPVWTRIWSLNGPGIANIFPQTVHGAVSTTLLCCRIWAERSPLRYAKSRKIVNHGASVNSKTNIYLTRNVFPQIGHIWLGFLSKRLCLRTCKFKYFLPNTLPHIVHGTLTFGSPECNVNIWERKFFFSLTFPPHMSHS